jgi:hypothetical protein
MSNWSSVSAIGFGDMAGRMSSNMSRSRLDLGERSHRVGLIAREPRRQYAPQQSNFVGPVAKCVGPSWVDLVICPARWTLPRFEREHATLDMIGGSVRGGRETFGASAASRAAKLLRTLTRKANPPVGVI